MSGHFNFCVRSERPVISSVGSNGYFGLNWTRGGLGAKGHVQTAYQTRPVFTVGTSGAASDVFEQRVWSMRSQPNN